MNIQKITLAFVCLGFISMSFMYLNPSEEINAATPAAEMPSIGLKVGDVAPDLILSSPDGEKYKLSDLRGKVVLIDFWASWCGPCRRENPNIVGAYKKYKQAKFKAAKGFEIYSVSLDSNVESWKAAIEKDGLDWDYHVSDLKKWNSTAARTYGISSIPSSFLIDAEGKIVAKGKELRGMGLHTNIDGLVSSLKKSKK